MASDKIIVAIFLLIIAGLTGYFIYYAITHKRPRHATGLLPTTTYPHMVIPTHATGLLPTHATGLIPSNGYELISNANACGSKFGCINNGLL